MKPAHKLGMMYMMAAAMNIEDHKLMEVSKKTQSSLSKEWNRKKCKSCKYIQYGNPCMKGKYCRPKTNACKQWKGK